MYAAAAGGGEVVAVSGVEEPGADLIVSRTGTAGRYDAVVVSADGVRPGRVGADGGVELVWLVKARFRPGDAWEAGGRGCRSARWGRT